MNFSTVNHYLMPTAFTFLLLLMLLYWSQAAFFGFETKASHIRSLHKSKICEVPSTFVPSTLHKSKICEVPSTFVSAPQISASQISASQISASQIPSAESRTEEKPFYKLNFSERIKLIILQIKDSYAEISLFTRISWQEKYKIFTDFIFFLSFLSLTVLIIFRWAESGHFPLSNLYESLLFLSWCFLSLKVVNFNFTNLNKAPRTNHQFVPTRHVRAEFVPAEIFLVTKRGFDIPVSALGICEAETNVLGSTNLLTNRRFVLVSHENANVRTSKESTFSDLGLGVILSPLSLLTFGFAFLSLPKEMQQSTSLVPALQSNWLMMHVTVMVLSYAALLSGSILAIAFLILNRFYDSKKTKEIVSAGTNSARSHVRFSESASLKAEITNYKFVQAEMKSNVNLNSRLDDLSYRILALGFPLLTIGILSGAVWANEAWGSYWSWDPKETWALITWLVFAIYLHTRITKGWSGEKPAIVASLGFFVVWFCYLGVNLLGNGLHSYGWFSS